MQLVLGGDAGVATLGPQLKLKKNVFQGVVVQVRDARAVQHVLAQLRALPRLRHSEHLPHAFRVRAESPLHPAVLLRALQPENDEVRPTNKKKLYRPPEDPTVAEDWEDDGETGVGDRLLHVLQRWQVENVLLVVARQDDSLSGRLIGHELFKLMVETAKLALEQYYESNITPTDAAKLEIFEAESGKAQYMITPRVETNDNQQHPQQPEQLEPPPKPRASVCLMTSDTIASWPAHHEPTSEGGGRKVAKKGRVNHFLHGRKASTPASPEKSLPTTNNGTSERVAEPAEPTGQPKNHHDIDALLACGGIDWLGITRDEWLKLRTIRVPVKELHYLFMCLVVLVDKPVERQSKAAPTSRQNEQYSAPSYSWNRCRDVLQRTAQWSEQLQHLHGSALTKTQVMALRSVLQEPAVNEAAFVRICSASVKLFAWIQRLLDEHDEHELGIANALLPGSDGSAEVGRVPPTTESPAAPLLPQPPPPKPLVPQPSRKATHKSVAFGSASAEESALVRELNALVHAKKNKIVDRGRLLSQKHLH